MTKNDDSKKKRGSLGWLIAGLLLLGGGGSIYKMGGLGFLPGQEGQNQTMNKEEKESYEGILEVQVKENTIHWKDQEGNLVPLSQEEFKQKMNDLNPDSKIRLVDANAVKSTYDFVKDTIAATGIKVIESMGE